MKSKHRQEFEESTGATTRQSDRQQGTTDIVHSMTCSDWYTLMDDGRTLDQWKPDVETNVEFGELVHERPIVRTMQCEARCCVVSITRDAASQSSSNHMV